MGSAGNSETPSKTFYLLGSAYDGAQRKAFLKFLDDESGGVTLNYDERGHKPYCYSKLDRSELSKNSNLKQQGVIRLDTITKDDLLREKKVELSVIYATDPLAIGGRKDSIREIIQAWEADIPYHLNYLYDRQLVPGMPYRVHNHDMSPVTAAPDYVEEIVSTRFGHASLEEKAELKQWLLLLEAQQPRIKHVCLDIEVISPVATRVPSPSQASDPVVAVSLASSDGMKQVFLLRRQGWPQEMSSADFKIKMFASEKDLLLETFGILQNYPVVATYNGDDFDLPYLRNRAEKIGLTYDQIPVTLGREGASLKRGVHLDLYRFFLNKSIQIYAFDNKYRENTLEGVSQEILGKGKVPIQKPISELPPRELAQYGFGDALLVNELMNFSNNLVIRLMIVLCRISRMPIEDVCRHGVSGWIRNLLYYEHRRRSYLIPRPEEILEEKGTTSTRAIIDGKKYRGAIVVEPIPGIHFNVTVLDFASLYPSALKHWNLSYETIRCVHPECRVNLIPETGHWVCTKRKGMQSLLIGSLRDIRVEWYKPRSLDQALKREVKDWYSAVQKALKVFLNASIPYDEEVVLQDPEGTVKILPIGEFVDESIRKNGGYFDGVNLVSRPLSGWKTLSVDRETRKARLADIEYVVRHELGREGLVQVELRSGRRVKVTPSHSLLTLDVADMRTRSVDASDLKPGDRVLVPISVPSIECGGKYINLVKELAALDEKLVADVHLFLLRGRPLDVRRRLVKVMEELSGMQLVSEDELVHNMETSRRTIRRYLTELEMEEYVRESQGKYVLTEKGLRYLSLERVLSRWLRRKKGRDGYYYVRLKDLGESVKIFDEGYAKEWLVGLRGIGKTKHKIPALIPISEELARLSGYYVAEGHADVFRNPSAGTSYRVVVTNTNRAILREVSMLFTSCLSLKPRVERDGKNVTLDSKIAYLLFVHILRAGKLAAEKQIPDCVMVGQNTIKLSFLEAYFAGDGTSRKNEIKLTSKSPRLINQLMLVLMQLGIKGLSISRDSGVWRLWIRYPLPFVGRNTKRKNYTETVPGELVQPLARLAKRYTYVRNGKNISRERALELINFCDGVPLAGELLKLLEGDVVLDKVKRITPYSNKCRYVYDLSVRGNENFVGGFGFVCLHNSYGVFGAEMFPLYCPPVAESTAAIGRYAFSEAIKTANSLGIQVVYGDTDSIFLRTDRKELVDKLISWTKEKLNLDLEFDKVYKYAVFSTRKKNYLGVTLSGQVDVKGLTGKKRHIPNFIKDAFNEMLDTLAKVESPDDFEKAKMKIQEIIKGWYHRLKKGEFKVEDLSFNVMLSRQPERYVKTTPQHVKAAKKLGTRGVQISAGDIISFVKTKDRDGVEPVRFAKVEQIDTEKYIEYLESTFEQVLDALELDFNTIIGVSSLESFLN